MITVYTKAAELPARIAQLAPYWNVPGYVMAHVIVYRSPKEYGLASRIADNIAVDMLRSHELEGETFLVSYAIDEELASTIDAYHALRGEARV